MELNAAELTLILAVWAGLCIVVTAWLARWALAWALAPRRSR